MTHPEFDHHGAPCVKLVEECAELTKAIAKAWRFGWDSRNPLIANSPTNKEDVIAEMQDVRRRLDELETKLDFY